STALITLKVCPQALQRKSYSGTVCPPLQRSIISVHALRSYGKVYDLPTRSFRTDSRPPASGGQAGPPAGARPDAAARRKRGSRSPTPRSATGPGALRDAFL